jgi:hypothetical protein
MNATPGPLYSRERPGIPSCRKLGGTQARSGPIRKILTPPGFDSRTVQPVASRYTAYVIPAPKFTFLYPEKCDIRQPVSPPEMPDKTVFTVSMFVPQHIFSCRSRSHRKYTQYQSVSKQITLFMIF